MHTKMKKSVGVLLVVCVVLSLFAGSAYAAHLYFEDAKGHWAEDAINTLSVTASSGYDVGTGEAKAENDERELPSTVTLLVSAEQSKVLAELESDGKLHLSLVYRGTPANTAKFITAQEKINKALYPAEQEVAAQDQATGTEQAATQQPTESEVAE